jgi:uncharacterized protein YigE (DUF2233 family)
MKFFSLLCLANLFPAALAAQWRIEDQSPPQKADSPLIFERKAVSRSGATGLFSSRRIDLIWFNDEHFTFKVIDNGAGSSAAYSSLADAMKANNCIAGSNGGFFLKDFAPSGLMIANGKATGTFGTGGLLSGVLLSNGKRNSYLLRRAEYSASKHNPTDLVQTGPFLVDQGVTVKGLSPENARRRTFVLHNGHKMFALGLSDSFTLADLGEILGDPNFSPAEKIYRALNLDGGTSSGFYMDRATNASPMVVEPFKRVRNFIGVVPRNP